MLHDDPIAAVIAFPSNEGDMLLIGLICNSKTFSYLFIVNQILRNITIKFLKYTYL